MIMHNVKYSKGFRDVLIVYNPVVSIPTMCFKLVLLLNEMCVPAFTLLCSVGSLHFINRLNVMAGPSNVLLQLGIKF